MFHCCIFVDYDEINKYSLSLSLNEFHDLNTNMLSNLSTPISIEVSDIEEAISQLGLKKSADPDNLFSEHFVYCHPSIVTHLKSLFNFILNHTYVSECFTRGIIIPIIKDRQGDRTSLPNYRPITISSTISKIF